MKKFWRWFLAIVAALLIALGIYIQPFLEVITGYAAKNLCSAVFVSGRDAADVEALDLNFFPINYASKKVNYEEKSVTARFLWCRATAVYRDGLGAIIVQDRDPQALRDEKLPVSTTLNYSKDTVDWWLGDRVIDSVSATIDAPALQAIAAELIDNQSYNGNPFAFMVVYKNTPVAERYRAGFNEQTRLLSWSMAKSFTNALAGVMTQAGMVDIFAPTDIEAWQNDERKTITINDLLRMQSGLEWNEDYGGNSDVNIMLHSISDMAEYAINKPLKDAPGSRWYYSSGSTNIAASLLKQRFATLDDYYTFVQERLFHKIGIENAVFEVDESGTCIGSSYVYATARDFARFGLLYLNNGVANGEQLLPENWVAYTATLTEASEGAYGSAFWLNQNQFYPDAPSDTYSCNGHDGQRIFIIPSREVVIVVLGYSPSKNNSIDFNRLLKDVLKTLE